jgi:uncharacterized protein (DUF1499 family)
MKLAHKVVSMLPNAIMPTPAVPATAHGLARLAPCPPYPNCVCTLATDPLHAIAPIPYTDTLADAKARLEQIVAALPRMTVLDSAPDYLHVMFRSRLFQFEDDVQFVFDDQAKLIHFRAAARLGQGDLGVNRRRMERIRHAFTQVTTPATTAPANGAARA